MSNSNIHVEIFLARAIAAEQAGRSDAAAALLEAAVAMGGRGISPSRILGGEAVMIVGGK